MYDSPKADDADDDVDGLIPKGAYECFGLVSNLSSVVGPSIATDVPDGAGSAESTRTGFTLRRECPVDEAVDDMALRYGLYEPSTLLGLVLNPE
jgi:hypothetical protein